MNRRSFLGFLGLAAGSVAVYAETPDALPTVGRWSLPIADARTEPPKARYVIVNEGAHPMVVHYRRTDPPNASALSRVRASQQSEAILLPGEELTITAVPMRT